MFAEIVTKARKLGSKPIIRKLFEIRIVESLARNLQSPLMRLAYAEMDRRRSKGPIEMKVADIAVNINWPNNASYFGFFDKDTNERVFLAYILEHTTRESTIYDMGANIGVFTLFFAKHGKEVVAFVNIR